jgi:hypothetical protein
MISFSNFVVEQDISKSQLEKIIGNFHDLFIMGFPKGFWSPLELLYVSATTILNSSSRAYCGFDHLDNFFINRCTH